MYKKNITLAFLLFLVEMPLVFSVYALIEKIIIEHRMEERLEQENLQTITIEAASAIWLTENKELLVNGEPFDVETISINGHRITATGLYDHQEKELKNQLEAFNYPEGKSAISNNSLLLLLFTTYNQPAVAISLIAPVAIHEKQCWQKYQHKICSLYHQVITPPPRLI